MRFKMKGTMSTILKLYELQQIDNDILKKEKRFSEIKRELADDAAQRKLEGIYKEAEAKKEGILSEQKSLEWDLGGVTEKYNKDKTTLYSGQVRNPKELAGLQQDVDSLKARVDKLEEKDLELMELLDEAQKEADVLKAELDSLKAKRSEAAVKLNAEKDGLEAALAKLYADKKEHRDALDAQTLDLYDTTLKQKGQAVCKLEQGVCRGCGIMASPTCLKQIRSGQIVKCSNCGRILHYGQ